MRSNPAINPKPCAPGTRPRPDTALDSVSEAPGGVSPDRLIISRPSPTEAAVAGPSVFYRAGFWRVGVGVARHLPHGLLGRIAGHLAQMYWAFNPARRRIVFENLLPVLNGDRLAARITTRELFQQFGFKLADLWRYECGLSIYNLFRGRNHPPFGTEQRGRALDGPPARPLRRDRKPVWPAVFRLAFGGRTGPRFRLRIVAGLFAADLCRLHRPHPA